MDLGGVMSAERCTIIKMNFRELDRAAENPQLAALLADGWMVASSLAVEDGPHMAWVLLMAPPQPKPKAMGSREAMGILILSAAVLVALVIDIFVTVW